MLDYLELLGRGPRGGGGLRLGLISTKQLDLVTWVYEDKGGGACLTGWPRKAAVINSYNLY